MCEPYNHALVGREEEYGGRQGGGIGDEVVDQLLAGRDPATVFENVRLDRC